MPPVNAKDILKVLASNEESSVGDELKGIKIHT